MAVTLELLRCGHTSSRAWLIDGSSWTRRITLPALVAVIRHPAIGTMLVDTGYGPALAHSDSPAARLYRRILPFTLPGASVLPPGPDCIFLTHFHPDHIGGLRLVPEAPILHSAEGLRALQGKTPYRQARAAFFPELLPADFAARARPIEALPAIPTDFGAAYDIAGDGALLAIPLPGHALGQYGLLCRLTGGREVFLVADAAWVRGNIFDSALPPFPVRALVDDYAAFVRTLELLRRWSAGNPHAVLIPSHCEESIARFTHGA